MRAHSAPVPRAADFQGFPGYPHVYCRIWWWEGRDYATMLWLPNIQTLFPQSDNFPLIKARAKILLSCHQDSWFISSSPSFHLFPRKHPVWHGPCRLIQPRWSLCPEGAVYPGRVVLAQLPLLTLNIFSFSVQDRGGWQIPHFSKELEDTPRGGYPPFTQHLCKVKQPERGNR